MSLLWQLDGGAEMTKVLRKLLTVFAKRNSNTFVHYLRKQGAQIGKNTTFINTRHASVDSGRIKYLSIGDNCVICSGVSFIMHDYSWYVLGNAYQELFPSGGQPISIGSNVFIGANSLVLGNTKIGDNVIVAAGSVVKGNLASDMIYGGNPAKPIMSLADYRQHRKERCIEDAKSEVRYYRDHFGRDPKPGEMMNYAVLFKDMKERVNDTTLGFEQGYYKNLCRTISSPYETYDIFLKSYKASNI